MPDYSHFNNTAPVGGSGLYVGADGSETQVADSSGNLFQAGTQVTASAAEINRALDASANTQNVTTTSATTTTAISHIELNVSSGTANTTIADLSNHQGFLTIKQLGASTSGCTVTATAGTFDGTNNVATTNAANDFLMVHVDSAGDGSIVENVGSVALS